MNCKQPVSPHSGAYASRLRRLACEPGIQNHRQLYWPHVTTQPVVMDSGFRSLCCGPGMTAPSAQRNLLLEGIDELCPESRREASIGDPVCIRQLVCRHVERAKCKVDKRK